MNKNNKTLSKSTTKTNENEEEDALNAFNYKSSNHSSSMLIWMLTNNNNIDIEQLQTIPSI